MITHWHSWTTGDHPQWGSRLTYLLYLLVSFFVVFIGQKKSQCVVTLWPVHSQWWWQANRHRQTFFGDNLFARNFQHRHLLSTATFFRKCFSFFTHSIHCHTMLPIQLSWLHYLAEHLSSCSHYVLSMLWRGEFQAKLSLYSLWRLFHSILQWCQRS